MCHIRTAGIETPISRALLLRARGEYGNERPSPDKPKVAVMTDFALHRKMMVDTQVRPSDVTKYPIIEAMLSVPREIFVPDDLKGTAYVGESLDLGRGRVLLDPRVLAKMLDALEIGRGDLVLDIGAATGYSSALLARMAQTVVALEEDDALAAEAEIALAKIGEEPVVVHKAPLVQGAAEFALFDVMIAQGGIMEFPSALVDQLAEGGRAACVFMDGALGVVRLGVKRDGKLAWRDIFNAAVPVLPGFEKQAAFTL